MNNSGSDFSSVKVGAEGHGSGSAPSSPSKSKCGRTKVNKNLRGSAASEVSA